MKKLLTVLLSAIMAVACVGFSVTVFAAEGEDAQTGSSLGLYTKETLNISNWWYAGNIITPDKFDTPAEQPVNGGAAGFAIPEEYGYLLFDIEVPDSIPLIIDIKTGANWLEWKFIPDALYYVRADGATAFTEAKINEKGELYLENFTGTVAVPFASYETTTADGYTINSLGIYQIVFHNTLGIAEDNDGYWNSKVSNLMLADEDYVFAPVQSTSESKNLGLYTKETLNISNWWYEGNVINPEQFDTPMEAEELVIDESYTYFMFDIEVPNSLPLELNIKTGNNWLEWKPAAGAIYYQKADGASEFTEARIDENGLINLEKFTGTIAIPLASFATTTSDGYTIYSLGIFRIIFHNILGTAEDNDGYWDSKVSNIMLANDDYVFQVEEGQVTFILLNQTIALAEPLDDGILISTDGTDIDMGKYWVTQSEMDAFTAALNTAKALSGSDTATQAEVDEARAALQSAMTDFEAAIKEGTHISENYGVLASNYTIALQGNLLSSFEGGAISDISPLFDKVKFAVDASSQSVDVYLSVFIKAYPGFEQGYNIGYSAGADISGADTTSPSYSLTRADRYYLLLEEGETLADRYSIDEAENIGTQQEVAYLRIPAGFKGTVWVPLTAFIPQYTGYMTSPDGELMEFSVSARDEVGSLPATDVRLTAEPVEEGLNVNYLSEAIAAATELAETVRVDTDGSSTSVAAQWVPQNAMDALKKAIETAQGVLDSAEGTESQGTVDEATAALNAAIEAFNEAASMGTKDYFAELSEDVAAAEELLNGTLIAADSSEVSPEEYWVTLDVATALSAAIEEAKALTADSPQTDLENAISGLNNAVADFEAARKIGTQGETGGNEEPEQPGGCGSSMLSVSIAGATILVAAGVVALRKKKD